MMCYKIIWNAAWELRARKNLALIQRAWYTVSELAYRRREGY